MDYGNAVYQYEVALMVTLENGETVISNAITFSESQICKLLSSGALAKPTFSFPSPAKVSPICSVHMQIIAWSPTVGECEPIDFFYGIYANKSDTLFAEKASGETKIDLPSTSSILSKKRKFDHSQSQQHHPRAKKTTTSMMAGPTYVVNDDDLVYVLQMPTKDFLLTTLTCTIDMDKLSSFYFPMLYKLFISKIKQ
jgi:hypothetical protein